MFISIQLVAGSVPKLIGITIVNIFIAVFGPIVYNTAEYPCFAQVIFPGWRPELKLTVILVCILLYKRRQPPTQLSPRCEHLCCILLMLGELLCLQNDLHKASLS